MLHLQGGIFSLPPKSTALNQHKLSPYTLQSNYTQNLSARKTGTMCQGPWHIVSVPEMAASQLKNTNRAHLIIQ